ncbi:MAG: hypothetical protein H5T61_15795 [Thermoflexales bacterium]|nr:hypothetical protein [Thermoflexales bacterium]
MEGWILADSDVVTVREGAEQWILLPPTPIGEALARLLGGEVAVWADGRLAVRHDREVDQRLVALIEVLVGLRWAHPVYVQLDLEGVR